MKRFAACSALFGALFLLTGCTVSIAQQPPSDDETIAPTEPSPAPASPQNTAPPTDAMTVEKPASPCIALAEKPCRNKKAEAERASMAARKVEARRKAEAKRKAAEQRKAIARRPKRSGSSRSARPKRPAKQMPLDAQLEASRSEAPPYIADKFKRAFERGRSAWLNAQ